jgi:hypothetical protein
VCFGQRVRRCDRRSGWPCFRRDGGRRVRLCARPGIRVRSIEHGGEIAPQGGKQFPGIRDARLGRRGVGDGLGECGEQQAQGFGIQLFERGVEDGTEFGTDAWEFFRGEGRIEVVLERRAAAGHGAAAMEPSREPAGTGWLGWRGGWSGARPARVRRLPGCEARAGISVHGVAEAGLRRGGPPQGAGESKATGDSVARRAAEAAEEARTNPFGLESKAWTVECSCHGWRDLK